MVCEHFVVNRVVMEGFNSWKHGHLYLGIKVVVLFLVWFYVVFVFFVVCLFVVVWVFCLCFFSFLGGSMSKLDFALNQLQRI